MNIDLPTAEELKTKINAKYAAFQITSKTPYESQQKIKKIRKDLKDFMKTSARLIEPVDLNLISTSIKTIQILGACTILPGFFLGYRLGSIKSKWFQNLPFTRRVLIRIFIMGIPVLSTYYYSYNLNERLGLYLEYKYGDRVQHYLLHKDAKVINPNH